jgi:hypothetical protein
MLPGTVEELVTNGLERLTQDALAARLGTVREVKALSLGEIHRSGSGESRAYSGHRSRAQA